jgi:hypothetical protein
MGALTIIFSILMLLLSISYIIGLGPLTSYAFGDAIPKYQTFARITVVLSWIHVIASIFGIVLFALAITALSNAFDGVKAAFEAPEIASDINPDIATAAAALGRVFRK